MRILKLGLISIVVLFVVTFLLSLLIPSQVRISRAINIGIVKDSLVPLLADMQKWKQWNEMVRNQEFTNKKFSHDSLISDQLKVNIALVTPDSIRTFWQYKKNEIISSGFNLLQPLVDTTVVQWYFDFRLKWYPWEKFGSIIFDQQLGPSMEISLENLRKLVHKKQ